MLPKGAIRLQKGAGGLPKGASKVNLNVNIEYNWIQQMSISTPDLTIA